MKKTEAVAALIAGLFFGYFTGAYVAERAAEKRLYPVITKQAARMNAQEDVIDEYAATTKEMATSSDPGAVFIRHADALGKKLGFVILSGR